MRPAAIIRTAYADSVIANNIVPKQVTRSSRAMTRQSAIVSGNLRPET
jgi:hypothetical protein